MPYKVVKFGGSNLRNKEGICNIVKAIKSYNQHLVIVVSAFYGITDKLIKAIQDAIEGTSNIDALIEDLYNQKIKILESTVTCKNLMNEFSKVIEARLNKLKGYFLGIKYINDIPAFLYDEILSYGERMSSLSLYYILRDAGIDCTEVLPEDMGLLTDGEFRNASVDLEKSAPQLKKHLSPSKTYIIPGFYGISPNRKTTLLGRGGSDYAAAAIASALDAQSLDLWKDVKGFLTADPTIIEDSVNVRSLTYAEAAELAYFGSKILHPRTPEPLVEKKIPIRILNINDAKTEIKPLTTINGVKRVSNGIIKSVSYSDNFGIIKLLGSGVGIKPGILAKSTVELDISGINIKSVITSQTAINILLSQDDLLKAQKLLIEKDIHGISSIEIQHEISLIAAVGEGLSKQYGIAGRLFSAVARKGINVQIISFGASDVAMYFIVNQNDRNATVREIHNEFFKHRNKL